MRINRAFKTEIKPTKTQAEQLYRFCGAGRYAWNWALARRKVYYRVFKKSVSPQKLDTHFRKMRKRLPEVYGWFDDIPSDVRQASISYLSPAFDNFFRKHKEFKTTGVKKKGKNPFGYPQFKSKKKSGVGSITIFFYNVDNSSIKIPKIGRVKLYQKGYIPVGKYGDKEPVKFMGCRISEKSGRWFASVMVEMDIPDVNPSARPVNGVDVGIKSLAVLSDGTSYANPKATSRFARKLARAQRRKAKRVMGSKNYVKAKLKIQSIHFKIACVRSDATHKATTDIVRKSRAIGLESLNVSGMLKNRKIAKSASDANMGEFLRQIQYKAQWQNVKIVAADRFYASSKTCSNCGTVKKELSLSERTFVCDSCGHQMGRDLNAAHNLKKLAESSAESINDCGG